MNYKKREKTQSNADVQVNARVDCRIAQRVINRKALGRIEQRQN